MSTYVVTGIGFGDEGKGTAVDYLARTMQRPLIIRATSGPQAAHNVVLPDGTQHTFSQFGSGLFAGADTVYTGIVCDPFSALKEAESLEKKVEDPYRKIVFSADSIISTPYHQAMNRLAEIARGNGRHGSCGYGINEAVTLASRRSIGLCVGDLFDRDGSLHGRIGKIKEYYEDKVGMLLEHFAFEDDEAETLINFVSSADSVDYVLDNYMTFLKKFKVLNNREIHEKIKKADNKIFESAQGVLLDPKYGMFFPYVTRLSPFDVRRFLDSNDYTHVYCMRTYMSRHGAGPLISEDKTIQGYDPHNAPNNWQGTMRYGHLDIPLLRYARDVIYRSGMANNSRLFVTHVDVLNEGRYVATYRGRESITPFMDNYVDRVNVLYPSVAKSIANDLVSKLKPEYKDANNLAEELSKGLRVPLGWISRGPTYEDKVAV